MLGDKKIKLGINVWWNLLRNDEMKKKLKLIIHLEFYGGLGVFELIIGSMESTGASEFQGKSFNFHKFIRRNPKRSKKQNFFQAFWAIKRFIAAKTDRFCKKIFRFQEQLQKAAKRVSKQQNLEKFHFFDFHFQGFLLFEWVFQIYLHVGRNLKSLFIFHDA